ncbi:tetratricopeptide repeat protein [Paraburkholderia caballeronis]|uniref:protein O-GlcNAc transferase n=1 Tax=Paraburkholderia caballeronis TaxID=416943 RepID=A0A1H7SPD4_9BURK|nr:tetratricopeptide repeat protein [Paraburkholderia caballeronis]PXW22415.1 putative O-linked N-acetylglucosamine transferase (SPINDLY family) [Paraburkholderia caballeronis]PXW96073.1 putative O-linked N-acetylglucosamine transferase (SPINDLY family) [Paraburkholderia caballeronis]RAJ92439.1 putative O-linked N-acetylglucosamine transferase (SPINDLY family) [Paraburkholderia caballeronis]TDV08016.1 putative O-linked N-acetylglucosamine transferase (SPINDLY family) [Paraburkholderia caballero
MSELKSTEPSLETADTLLARADTLCRAERFDEAEELCRTVLDAEPGNAAAIHLHGIVAYRRGDYDLAVERLMDAITRAPRPDYYFTLGNVMATNNRPAAAAECFSLATQLQPDYADAYNNLGTAQRALKQYHDAVQSFCKVLELQPQNGRAYNNLANALLELNELPAALEAWAIAHQLAPDYPEPLSNRLFALHYENQMSPEQYLADARYFGDLVGRAAQPFRSWLVTTTPRTDRPLRVGIVSGDLRRHPVGYFLASVVGALDKQRIELFGYPTRMNEDELTESIKPHFSQWQSIATMSDIAAAQQVRGDQIDILIDASGHTTSNRLSLFAWKPAPIQVSWPGYFASTGLATMDYVLGDPHVLPEGEEAHFVEKPWRLPDSYLCFTPPQEAPEVGPLPMTKNGFITFGYFGRLTKVTDSVIAAWAEILRRVPGAQLFIKSAQLDFEDVRDMTVARFAAQGIGADRLLLEGFSGRDLYLDAYNRVDVTLSPFPYPSGTTAAESLWMGVPVLCRKGDRFSSHIAESILHTAGLGDAWIANDQQDYIGKAVALASDASRLAVLRASLRAQTLASPLCDAPRFARNLESALHAMWDDYIAKRRLTKREA